MSDLYIGADLGTSGLKIILMRADGTILKTHLENYPINYPKPAWAEQNPESWYNAIIKGIQILLKDVNTTDVKGIGLAGQMHGLVTLDKKDEVIRQAILWNDGRATIEASELNDSIGVDNMLEWTNNIAFAGFTAPKIMWMRKNEPDNFSRIVKIMLPKDYLVYRMTGEFTTDLSDASGTLLIDVKNSCWSIDMLNVCGIKKEQLPTLHQSYDKIGTLKPEIADKLGLQESVFVIAGASDNAAAAIAAGTVGDCRCNISIGTSGTVFVSVTEFQELNNPVVHNFAHADGNFHYLGCMLSAASANNWWVKEIINADFLTYMEDTTADLGHNQVFFLPCLMGERSPYNNPNARGAFVGMNQKTSQADMSLAVLEGVAFGLRDSLEMISDSGIKIERATLVGGGARNKLWCKVVANVLGIDINLLSEEIGPSFGIAILTAYADGQYETLEDACSKLVKIEETLFPDYVTVEAYNGRYMIYKQLYPALTNVFDMISKPHE